MLKITAALRSWLQDNCGLAAGASDDAIRKAAGEALASGKMDGKKLAELAKADDPGGAPTPFGVFGGGGQGTRAGRYSTTKKVGLHVKTGKPVHDPIFRRDAEEASELEKAKTGVFLRALALRSNAPVPLRPLSADERRMWDQMVNEDAWTGAQDGSDESKVYAPGQMKADLLSDTTSGGVYLNPLWYDYNIVTFPLLFGELAPFVDIVDMPRSATVNSASVGNPSVTWGQTDAESLTVLDATALVGQLNSTVQNVMVAIKVSIDLLNDVEPANLGDYLVANIGQRMQQELDRVIATGNGSTEPQGIAGSSGLNLVNSDNNVNGPATIGDYEALYFSIAKQYRASQFNPAYVANDVSYRRARAIPVGPGDERRVFGMTHGDYSLLDMPYRIVNAVNPGATTPAIANNKIAFGALRKYRLYRRLGFFTRWTWEGQTLGLNNEALLIVRGRFAGRVMDPNAFALMSDGQN
jgi:HK97 family phage major capsid protein